MKKLFDNAFSFVNSVLKKDDLLGVEFLRSAAIGNLNGMKMLLAKGVSPDVQNDDDGKTALHIAVEKNNLPLIQFLLAAGARGEIKDSTHHTPLMHAVEKNNQRAIKILCEDRDKSGINETNFVDETAVNIALRVNQLNVARFLLDHGANPDFALRRAIKSNNDAQMKWLCQYGANPNLLDPTGTSQLSRALQIGDIKGMEKWIAWGADINFTGGNGLLLRTQHWSPLMMAIDMRRHEAVALLLANPKIDISITAPGEVSALTLAIGKGSLETVEQLKAMGANLPERLADGTTPLMLASLSGKINLVQVILDWRPQNINEQDKKGWTALMYAVKANSKPIVELLLKNGADRNLHSIEYKFTAQKIAQNQKAVIPQSLPDLHLEIDQIVNILGPD